MPHSGDLRINSSNLQSEGGWEPLVVGDPGAERDCEQTGDRGEDEGEQGPGSGDKQNEFARIFNVIW